MRHLRAMGLGLLSLAAAGQARAQDSTAAQQDTSAAEPEERGPPEPPDQERMAKVAQLFGGGVLR